jgi:hypothetical protein
LYVRLAYIIVILDGFVLFSIASAPLLLTMVMADGPAADETAWQ